MFGSHLYSARRFARRATTTEHEHQLTEVKSAGRHRRRSVTVGAAVATVGLISSALVTGSGLFVTAAAPVGAGFTLDARDIQHIFQQIEIAEAHAAGGDLFGPGANQVPEVRLPFGLRTVDGSYNHLVAGQTNFGAADQVFPRLTTPYYRDGEVFDPDGDGPAPSIPTSYNQTKGIVADSAPRIISNLIVDQTQSNPAAIAASGGCPELDGPTCYMRNESPDVGLSAPFNSMFTFFGQFFDHGLDLVTKGGGTVFTPLQPDDPLYVEGSPTNFLVLTRATNQPGPDGITGDRAPTDAGPPVTCTALNTPAGCDESADDIKEATNTTTPFVDQNQTYTSHPAHQVFLREYASSPGGPVSTGRLIDGTGGNIGNWDEVKAQAATMLGIELIDADVLNVPLLVTDPYGRFLRGLNGFPMLMFPGNVTVEGNPGAPISTVGSMKTGHSFLDDIAHNANPKNSQTGVIMNPDADGDIDDPNIPRPAGTYDDELLDEHFITGDGRGNENIGLTAVHTIFHSEHNRLQTDIDGIINTSGLLSAAETAAWHAIGPSGWDYGERLFQAARFVTEMEYQHLVFEEFARKLVPTINPFIGDGINFQSDTNPAISAEFAHTVYRLGHSMLTENIKRTNENGSTNDITLFEGFLNPLEFNDDGFGNTLTAAQAAGAIFQGGGREAGNHIDEFITNVVRNQLLGLPQDLAVFNLSRGRSEGIPPLNSVRRQLFDQSGESALAPYDSWMDFSFNQKYPESLINFIAAYGTHPLITTFDLDGPVLTDEFPGSLNSRRSAAEIITNGVSVNVPDVGIVGPPADSEDFLSSLNDWANNPDGSTITGVDVIDLWVGGLAERTAPFGGMLGSTFNYIFELQLEDLQNADRFYYLERLDGLNLLVQLEANSFAEIIMRNTTAVGLPADVFSTPDFVFNMDNIGASGPILDDPSTDWDESGLLVRLANGTVRFNGGEHVLWNGVDQPGGPSVNDKIISSEGDDSLRGNGGNDVMEGGSGNDNPIGGEGDDILTDIFGDDVMKGGPGNDAITGGPGFDLLQGNAGDDYMIAGNDSSESFGGAGDDVMYTGDGGLESFAGAGDDWIEGGPQLDLLVGDENNQFQDDANQGHDVIIGGKGDDDYDSEGGDDIMVGDVLGTERFEGMLGFDLATYRGDPLPVDADMNINVVLAPNLGELRDRFDLTEGMSGWNFNDLLRGTDHIAADLVGHELNAAGIARIAGIAAMLPTGATSWADGDIIMGGTGSDEIEGRGGDDILDGDRWLNVQLQAPNPATPNTTDTKLVSAMKDLRTDVIAGRINPGTIDIVRSIVTPTAGQTSGNIDTALFSAPLANYTIIPNGNGSVTVADNVGTDGVDTLWNMEQAVFCDTPGPTPGSCALRSAPVSLTDFPVASLSVPSLSFPSRAVPAGATTLPLVLTNTGGSTLSIISSSVTGVDATSFSATSNCISLVNNASCTFTVSFDPTVVGALSATLNITTNAGVLAVPLTGTGIVNTVATGAPLISDTTPTEGTAITASLGTVADVNGVPGVVGFVWRQSLTPTGAVNTVIPGATTASFTPGPTLANRRLTVTVTFVDDAGTAEARTSAITTVVGDVFIGTGIADLQVGTAGQDEYHGGGGNDNLSTGAQDDIVSGDADDDTIATGGGDDTITFTGTGEGFDAVTGGAGVDDIIALANNTNIGLQSIATVETISANGFTGVRILGSAVTNVLNFTAVTLTGIVEIDGGGGNDNITGSAGPDVIIGRDGTDTLNGGIGADTIEGGANNDALNGGANNDVFRYLTIAGGFGADTITGFDANPTGGQDLINLTGLGINAGNFAANVTIATDPLGGTRITIAGQGTIRLAGIAVAAVTITDFQL